MSFADKFEKKAELGPNLSNDAMQETKQLYNSAVKSSLKPKASKFGTGNKMGLKALKASNKVLSHV